jgi:hypothetical protein
VNFLMSHDGRTYAKHTECPEQGTTDVLFDEVEQHLEQEQSLEPSGDDE